MLGQLLVLVKCGQRVKWSMRVITSARLLYLKGILFLLCGLLACGGILIDRPSWKIAALLAVAIWAFARAYYFVFYVIEHYIDPSQRYAGLIEFVRATMARRRGDGPGDQ